MTIECAVRVELEFNPTVNYALQINHIPIIQRITVTNSGDDTLSSLTLTIHSTPEFAFACCINLPPLSAGQSFVKQPVDLQLCPEYLLGLNERIAGELKVSLTDGSSIVQESHSPIDLLAHDEWNGTQVLPEILAAFVTPNCDAIWSILGDAADLLGKGTGSSALDGYQSGDPQRVLAQLDAIFRTIQSRMVRYCTPMASFEAHGQKIRTPDAIFEQGLGTCLDLAVLFAACAEAAGLHPLVVIVEGHAFPAVWLVDKTFPTSVEDDVTALTKRTAEGTEEICVVESTFLTEGSGASLVRAIEAAKVRLRHPETFGFLVDIKRARAAPIRPLPGRHDSNSLLRSGSGAAAQSATEAPDSHLPRISLVPEPEPAACGHRGPLDMWKSRLLDLSLRNPLLNFRRTGSSVGLLIPHLPGFEDRLASGQSFQLHPCPEDWETRDVSVYLNRESSDPWIKLLDTELDSARVRAKLASGDLSPRLNKLYLSAKTSLEDNGANTLYLALGFLKWYESATSQRAIYSPLLLVPAQLVRKRLGSYELRAREDEDTFFNVTLLEKLKRDFGIAPAGIDPIPQDERGVDVTAVMAHVTRAVMSEARWEVVGDAYLGLFSFSKFVMWRDLENRTEELRRSVVVSSLMDGRLRWNPGRMAVEQELDQKFHPRDLLCPVSSDSSQLAAVVDCHQGESLVLHGPPGTGKSQTITNIIANAVGTGKSVLFVAEKMAALSVVQRRLAAIGLGDFCLELHSNKTNKRNVSSQLTGVLNLVREDRPAEWDARAICLKEERETLNSYVDALHRRRAIGLTLYEVLSRLSAVSPYVKLIPLESESVDRLTSEKWQQWQDLAGRLRAAAEGCGHPGGHPWADSQLRDCPPFFPEKVRKRTACLRSSIQRWVNVARKSASILMVGDPECLSYWDLCSIKKLSEQLQTGPPIPDALLSSQDWTTDSTSIPIWVACGRRRDALRLEVFKNYSPAVLELDLSKLQEQLRESDTRWLIPRMLGRSRIARQLSSCMRPGLRQKSQTMSDDLERLLALQQEQRAIDAARDAATSLLGELWNEGNADWDAIVQACDWMGDLRKTASHVGDGDNLQANKLLQCWGRLRAGSRGLSQDDAEQMRTFAHAAADALNQWTEFAALTKMNSTALAGDGKNPSWFDRILLQIDDWEKNCELLPAWAAWSRTRDEVERDGLAFLVSSYLQDNLEHSQVAVTLEKSVYNAWAQRVVELDASLARFSRSLFEHQVHQFRELDDQFEQLTRKELRARLLAHIPPKIENANEASEVGIVLAESNRKRGHRAIRTLLSEVPNLLPRLKPCLLMSPLSVAQYLDPSHPPFDLVVFDEASQVPTWDAVGALARGKKAVVVGDPNQLPPTSFFTITDSDSSVDEDELEEYESILNACQAVGVPERSLRWHYRSEHESLIAFSNYNYYDNSLLTFPSVNDLESAVTLRRVEGFYDRGKSKQNRAEAEAVAAEIIHRLKSPALRHRSIGVVALSQAQQSLIQQLLDEAVEGHPELGDIFSAGEQRPEPVFIKNLENVQGDERDVILLSIGYGPDEAGKVSLNFGPVNQANGWRRLNVAVSRARSEMIVFSTLRADQIDLSRTNARGVGDLKKFLQFAELGKKALITASETGLTATVESIFEEQVCKVLRDRGHSIHLQVGCAGYRIDLAVAHPELPGRYVLGIECDGAMYHSAKTARDRDKLREAILRKLGWTIHRVWSRDWWERPADEVRRIEEAIANALAASTVPAPNTALEMSDPAPAQVDCTQVEATSDAVTEPLLFHTSASRPAPEQQAPSNSQCLAASTTSLSRSSGPLIAGGTPPSGTLTGADTDLGLRGPLYRAYRLPEVGQSRNDFHSPASSAAIGFQIYQVVGAEGPISHRLLCHRIATAWGWKSVGKQIENRIQQLCSSIPLTITQGDSQPFYWPPGVNPGTYALFRLPGSEKDTRRAPADLPPDEIANAVLHVLRSQISLPEENLLQEVAALLGYGHLGSDIRQNLGFGVARAVERGIVQRDSGNRLVLAG